MTDTMLRPSREQNAGEAGAPGMTESLATMISGNSPLGAFGRETLRTKIKEIIKENQSFPKMPKCKATAEKCLDAWAGIEEQIEGAGIQNLGRSAHPTTVPESRERIIALLDLTIEKSKSALSGFHSALRKLQATRQGSQQAESAALRLYIMYDAFFAPDMLYLFMLDLVNANLEEEPRLPRDMEELTGVISSTYSFSEADSRLVAEHMRHYLALSTVRMKQMGMRWFQPVTYFMLETEPRTFDGEFTKRYTNLLKEQVAIANALKSKLLNQDLTSEELGKILKG